MLTTFFVAAKQESTPVRSLCYCCSRVAITARPSVSVTFDARAVVRRSRFCCGGDFTAD